MKGDHSIRGVGIASCEVFVNQLGNDRHEKFLFAGWLNGYITAWNQTKEDTFEVASWQTLDTLAEYLRKYCTDNPDKTFYSAVSAMVTRLMPYRLNERSDMIRFKNNNESVVIYQTVLQRVKDELEKGSFLKNSDRNSSEYISEALREYQKSKGIDDSGLPDQPTLHRMFLYGK